MQPQPMEHGVRRVQLRAVIQVSVDVGGGGKIAVPQPLLNLLHGYAVGQQERSTAVPQVVEADVPESVGLEQLRELLRNVLGVDQLSDVVDADIVQMLPRSC